MCRCTSQIPIQWSFTLLAINRTLVLVWSNQEPLEVFIESYQNNLQIVKVMIKFMNSMVLTVPMSWILSHWNWIVVSCLLHACLCTNDFATFSMNTCSSRFHCIMNSNAHLYSLFSTFHWLLLLHWAGINISMRCMWYVEYCTCSYQFISSLSWIFFDVLLFSQVHVHALVQVYACFIATVTLESVLKISMYYHSTHHWNIP